MRRLDDDEVLFRVASLKKRHRVEWCQLVYEACVGRSTTQVVELLGFSQKWVVEHLDGYAINDATRGADGGDPRNRVEDLRQVISNHSPEEPDEDYVAEYEAEGYTPEVSARLAKAYQAAENAIDAGVIDRPSGRIIPEVEPTDWVFRLRRACADVKAAAGLLDRARINDLRRVGTRKEVSAAHAKWVEQIERLENFHPTFKDEVVNHEA